MVAELPDETLRQLSESYPLKSDKYDSSDSRSMLITIAVHEELQRRATGGQAKKRIPALKELAAEIVKNGFRHLSKTHHPDKSGSAEAQRRLTEARDHLLNSCVNFQEDDDEDAIVIPFPDSGPEISDEDIPF
jgi:hypothetical protein